MVLSTSLVKFPCKGEGNVLLGLRRTPDDHGGLLVSVGNPVGFSFLYELHSVGVRKVKLDAVLFL